MKAELGHSRLGKLPAHWSVMRLGAVTERTSTPVDVDPHLVYREIGIRSHGKGIFHKEPVKGQALGDKRVFHVVPHRLVVNIVFAWEGAVAVTSENEAGMVASHRFPMFGPTSTQQIDVRFLFRFFQTELGIRLLGEASPGGAGRNRTLNQKFAIEIPVPIPPIHEQQKVASILASVDDAIEAAQGVVTQLQVVKKAMMAELLTRGLPHRHTNFKQAEVGVVPSEWGIERLGQIGDWLSGGTPTKKEPSLWAGPVPWVSPKDMKQPRIADAIDHVSEKALTRGTRLAPRESVLMVVRGMILAHTFPVAVATAPVAFNQDIKVLVPNSSFRPEFVLYWLQAREQEILKLVDLSNHGTKRLPTELLFNSPIPKPRVDEQDEIIASLRTLDMRHQTEMQAYVRLRTLRNALRQGLLTGEVRTCRSRT